MHHGSVSAPTAVIPPAAVEFLCVSVALVDGVDQGEEVKSHPPTASFMSPILVSTVLIIFSNIIQSSRLVTAISYGVEGTLR